jgi:riboflavin kinase/FMN adenylyltransferase
MLPSDRPLVLGLGVFDGVHLGHRKIISELCAMAERCQAVPAAVTFDPHPRAVLCPSDPPQMLLPLEERCRQLRLAGAALTGVIPFSSEFGSVKAEDFLDYLFNSGRFRLAGICVGSRWRFGCRGAGNRELIQKFAEKNNIEFVPCQELVINGETVSSSAIRRSTAAGYLEHARAMLGRPVRIFGKVQHGNKVAGSVLEAPTANIDVAFGVLPPDGVYSGRVNINGVMCPAAVNIGFSPTFQVNRRRVEAHVLDFSGSLYGMELELELLDFLREEKSFSSPEELMQQIKQDIARIRTDFEQAKGE